MSTWVVGLRSQTRGPRPRAAHRAFGLAGTVSSFFPFLNEIGLLLAPGARAPQAGHRHLHGVARGGLTSDKLPALGAILSFESPGIKQLRYMLEE